MKNFSMVITAIFILCLLIMQGVAADGRTEKRSDSDTGLIRINILVTVEESGIPDDWSSVIVDQTRRFFMASSPSQVSCLLNPVRNFFGAAVYTRRVLRAIILIRGILLRILKNLVKEQLKIWVKELYRSMKEFVVHTAWITKGYSRVDNR